MKHYLIWSEEHGQWWASRSGYTNQIELAARFTEATAKKIVEEANAFLHPEDGLRADRTFNEIMIPDPIAYGPTPKDRP